MKRNKKGQFTKGSLVGQDNYNWTGGMVMLQCRNCEQDMLRYPSRLKVLTGQSKIFCSFKCKGEWQSRNSVREHNPHWKGGKRLSKEGYIQIYLPEHHRANQNGYVLEHILIAEKKYSRKIYPKEHIHHLNGIKWDNRPNNLFLTTNSKHDKLSIRHALQERIRELEITIARI